MQNFESRNDIKARILQNMAREWGYKNVSDIDLNAFDPIVDLLLGACSFELEKVSNEIINSRNRIFERLVEILTPDIMANAQPAYAVMHADPVEPKQILTPSDQLAIKSNELNKDILFAPVHYFPLHQANICYLGYDNKVVKLNDQLQQETFFEAAYGRFLAPGEYYIGLRANPNLRSLHQLSFFFDWKNETRATHLKKFLAFSKWKINDRDINMKMGCPLIPPPSGQKREDIFYLLSPEKYLEKNILNSVNSHFLSIDQPDLNVPSQKTNYPESWETVFDLGNLEQMNEPLIWIKAEFSQALYSHLGAMECQTNCFPVLNKQLHEKQEKLHPEIHILPLQFEDGYFHSMENMENSAGDIYNEVPLKIVDKSDQGMYAIRHKGVNRFDAREANELLTYLMDVLKEESAAFRALGYQTVGADIKEMDVVFRRMYKNINKSKSEMQNTSYLFIQPFLNDPNIFLNFWTTDGELANGLPHGMPARCVNRHDLLPASVQLVTGTKEGRAPLQSMERVEAFRNAIITRGKVVTSEDIKSFCAQKIGLRNIENIKIKKGVMNSQHVREGLIRCIDVHVFKKRLAPVVDDEWNVLCRETENELSNRSSSTSPIRIISHEFSAS